MSAPLAERPGGSRGAHIWAALRGFGGSLLQPGDRRRLGVLLVCWLGAYALLARPETSVKPSLLSRADGTWMYLQMRSHLLDRDWQYENDYLHAGRYANGTPKWKVWLGVTSKGKPGNPWTMGTGWMLAPFFLAGHGLALATGAPDHGVTLTDQYVTYLGTVCYAFWGFVLIFGMARRRFGSVPALVGCVAVLLGSPLFFYTTYVPSFSHGVAFFCAACLLWCWDVSLRPGSRPVPALWRWALYGGLTGLAALVRPQLVLFAGPAGLWWLVLVARHRRRPAALLGLAAAGGLAAGAALLVFAPQMIYWHQTYGSWLVVPQGSWFMRWDDSLLWETLFSARGGLFVVTPLLWLAALGLLLSARRDAALAALGTGLVLLLAFVNGAAWDFWAGWTYGARRFTCVVSVLMIGGAGLIAVVRDAARRRPRLYGWGAAALLVLPLLLFSQWNMHQVIRRYSMSAGVADRDMSFLAKRFLDDGQRAVGNPFTWPHALWLRLRFGVPLSRYSRLVTDYPLEQPPRWVRRHGPGMVRAHLDLRSHRWSKLVLAGAREAELHHHRVWEARGTRVDLLIPLRIQAHYRFRLEVLTEAPPKTGPVLNLRPVRGRVIRGTLGPARPHRHLRGLYGQWVTFDIPKTQTRSGVNPWSLFRESPRGAPPLRFRHATLEYVR